MNAGANRRVVGGTRALLLLGCLGSWSSFAEAVTISWTDWTSADATSATGTVNGVIVSFDGAINPAAQTVGGTNFWASNPSTYTSPPAVDNGPPDSDIIRLTGGTSAGLQTITFSEPVVDPVMTIMSLGQPSVEVRYVFANEDFDILNNGPGFFGNGPLTELAGNVLQGFEGHGLIRFNGTFTSIDWTIPLSEFWHGFQVGITAVGRSSVPEPATLALIALGLAGIFRQSRHHFGFADPFRSRKRA